MQPDSREIPGEPPHILVFTLPQALNPLAQGNPRLIYTLPFHATADTLATFARDPRHLGGDLGVTAILHTSNAAPSAIGGDCTSPRSRRRCPAPFAPGTAALGPPAVRAFQSALPARRTLPRSAAVAPVARSRHP